MSAESDPILCFQHCQSDVNIVCLEIPETCPICKASLVSTPMTIPPFRLQSPFVHSAEAPYAIVIRPTNGDFLKNYDNTADLHVGISDSEGAVFDYSQHGLQRHSDGWSGTLAVKVTPGDDFRLRPLWDAKLNEFTAYEQWNSNKYSEKDHNCFSFALGFLQLLNMQDVLPCIGNKSDFCDQMIVPLATKASKYIALHRYVRENGAMVQYNTTL